MTDLLSSTNRDVQRALANSRRIARQYRQKVVAPDHLLLGLLELPGSQSEAILEQLQVRVPHLQARLEARIKLAAREGQAETAIGYSARGIRLSPDSAAILNEAQAEAEENHLSCVDPRLVLLGMLRCPESSAGQLLGQYGVTPERFREAAHLAEQAPVNLPRLPRAEGSLEPKAPCGWVSPLRGKPRLRPTVGSQGVEALAGAALPIWVSPVFLGLLAVTATFGYLAYAGIGNPGGTVFVFVTGGWILSVALHEFGHALVAYLGGDKSVVDKGYLTLNPLKYTHPVFSIFVPLLFLFMGGIGLPGGAVYVNTAAIRKDSMRCLVSAAGPLATLVCAGMYALPFVLGWHYALWETHEAFWGGLAFLLFLQIMGLCLNLLPLPGLDGFGILEPFLPPNAIGMANMIRPFSFILLFAFISYDTPVSTFFWESIWQIAVGISPDLGWLVSEGYTLFRFWMNW